MAIKDAPDGTLWVQNVDVIVDWPEPPSPANETAITKLDRLTTSSTDYDTVVSWTVDDDKVGILLHVELWCSNYAKTRWQLTIAGVVQFTDIEIGTTLSLEWPNVRLAAGDEVLLEAKSSDTTEVNVDGDITGKEIG